MARKPPSPRRERSARYPGVALGECVALCRFVNDHGLDGLAAADIASALGYRNLRTNTFSALLSAARQFGLLALDNAGYTLTDLARTILAIDDAQEAQRLYRQALLSPSLYAQLAERLGGKRVPDAEILAGVLENNYQITAAGKHAAASAFLESARFAGALGDDLILRPEGAAPGDNHHEGNSKLGTGHGASRKSPKSSPAREGVRFALRLWGSDQGKTVRVRAPESMTRESLERLVKAIRLFVRVTEPGAGDAEDSPD